MREKVGCYFRIGDGREGFEFFDRFKGKLKKRQKFESITGILYLISGGQQGNTAHRAEQKPVHRLAGTQLPARSHKKRKR